MWCVDILLVKSAQGGVPAAENCGSSIEDFTKLFLNSSMVESPRIEENAIGTEYSEQHCYPFLFPCNNE